MAQVGDGCPVGHFDRESVIASLIVFRAHLSLGGARGSPDGWPPRRTSPLARLSIAAAGQAGERVHTAVGAPVEGRDAGGGERRRGHESGVGIVVGIRAEALRHGG